MTDRELLEMAAKAAGIEGEYSEHKSEWNCVSGYLTTVGIGRSLWNPLTDDGKALRLAVKLGLDLLRTDQDIEAIAGLPPYAKIDAAHVSFPFGIIALGDDAYAATRRAIVRAAAEIGRSMP